MNPHKKIQEDETSGIEYENRDTLIINKPYD